MTYRDIEEYIRNFAFYDSMFERVTDKPQVWRHACNIGGINRFEPITIECNDGKRCCIVTYIVCPFCHKVIYYAGDIVGLYDDMSKHMLNGEFVGFGGMADNGVVGTSGMQGIGIEDGYNNSYTYMRYDNQVDFVYGTPAGYGSLSGCGSQASYSTGFDGGNDTGNFGSNNIY